MCYVLTLTNLGPADAVNVVLADTLPLGLTPSLFAQLSGPGASLAFDGIRTFTAAFGSLVAGVIAIFRVGATVNTGTGGGTLTNTAGVGSDIFDPDPANNTASASTPIEGADLVLTKAGPASANEGASVYYELTLTNLGPADAANVVLADTLPLGLTPSLFAQLSGPGASLSSDGIRAVKECIGR